VTSAATETSLERNVEPVATAAIVRVAALVTVLHCVASTLGSGYWFDEAYMLAIGRFHLEWGSADQPPAAPALAR
jgi:hypothetical protein